jgi:hypothetical protein
MASFWIEYQDIAMNLKQIQTLKKKIHYDMELGEMSYDVVINDGLNEMFSVKYEFKFNTEEQMKFHYDSLLNKIKSVDWIVFL